MKIVVDVPDGVYNTMEDDQFISREQLAVLQKHILDGKPIPKGCGRLIDADAFERRCMFDSDIEDMQDVIYALRDYKAIVEAEEGEK